MEQRRLIDAETGDSTVWKFRLGTDIWFCRENGGQVVVEIWLGTADIGSCSAAKQQQAKCNIER